MTCHSYQEFITKKYGKKTYTNIINYQEKNKTLKIITAGYKILKH